MLALTFSLFLYALTAWVLVGWGSIITRLFRMRLPGAQQSFSQLWLGLALGLLALQLINYFAPVNWIVTTLLAVGGLVAWWFNGHRIPRLPSTPPRDLVYALLFILAVLLSALWIALQSMQPLTINESICGSFQ